MEKGRKEPELDEFEKLLGEIPNATSGNPHSGESVLNNSSVHFKSLSLDDSLSFDKPRTICVKSSKAPFSGELQNNGSLDEGKISVNKIQQSPIKRVQPEEPYLPDDQSLTSAFAELSFNDGVAMEAMSPPVVNYKSLPNHTSLLDRQYPNSLKKPSSNMDSRIMVVPSPLPPNNSSSGFDEFDGKKNSQEGLNLLKLGVQELKKQQVGYFPPIENFSGATPLAHEAQGFQFLSNVPVPGVEFPVVSDQQQYFLDTQSPLPYSHSQQLSQHQITWRHMEEERYYRMHRQYLYLQQLRNQRLGVPIQANGSVATRIMGRNPRQPYFEMPISHQLEQSNQEPFWNSYAIPRVLNRSGPAISSADFNAVQVSDKVGKQSFPEKILTRSHGLNSLRVVKFGSVGGNESLTHVNQSGRVLSNGHFCPSLSTSIGGCFQLDSLSSQGLSPETTDLKNTNLRLLSQKSLSLDEVTGRIYLMAKDQHGCRFLQRKFTEGTPKDVEKIFLEIIDHIVELMTDPFGNYLVQKLLEVCDEDQQMQIVHAITRKAGELVRISCDMHGTRAVQKVIETLKTPEQFSMVVSSLKPGIVNLIKNTNGNHVAQRCLQYLMPEYSEFLFEAATSNCIELATDRHGCCVLQKCLSHADGEQRCHLICKITSNALFLSQDPFGNYGVQFVLELRDPWATIDILDQLEGNYGDLSIQKHSSNVVEKCLKHAGEEHRPHIIQELINNPRLDQIMQDPYGNYVIQAALRHSKGAPHAALVEAIRPHVPVLRTSPYGKKVLSSNSLKK